MKQNLQANSLRTGVLFTVVVFLLLVVLPSPLHAQGKGSLDLAIQNSAKHIIKNLPEGSKIAIYDFDLKDINTISSPDGSNPLNDRIIRDLTTYFSNETPRIKLLPRQQLLDAVMQELYYQHRSGNVSKKEIKEVGEQLGADFVITGSINRRGSGYRLYVEPVHVETGEVKYAAPANIRKNDPDLNSFLIAELKPEKNPFRILAGARAGVATHFWTLSNDIKGDAESPSAAVAPAVQGTFYFNDLFALQTELAVSIDKVSYSGTEAGGEYTASFESVSLQLPVLARFTYRPGNFSLSGFGGIVFNIPMATMNLNSTLYDDSSYRFSTPPGYVVGTNLGWGLGPGFLFTDIRFSSDFTTTSIHDSDGTLALYKRNALSFTLGYEFEFKVKR